MTVHALYDAAPFAACSRLFRRYPQAVTLHFANGGYRSMVLVTDAAGPGGFFVLSQTRDDRFVLRSWDRHDGIIEVIGPGEPASDVIGQVIGGAMPVPHDGALLGWVTGSRVTAIMAVRGRQPETWDTPVPVPEIRVMPAAGTSELLHWPPFTASPLDDERLWEYVERGEIVDVAPLVTQGAGRAFWVPAPDRRGARHGCVVVTDNLPGDEYWLPAGVYTDHWTLREGIQPLPAACLLTLPGVVDLAYGLQ
jgi:hypothetical protein